MNVLEQAGVVGSIGSTVIFVLGSKLDIGPLCGLGAIGIIIFILIFAAGRMRSPTK